MTKPLAKGYQVRAALSAAREALAAVIAERDRLIATEVADPEGMKLYEIGAVWDLSVPRVHAIAKQQGVERGRVPWPLTCSRHDCERPHHSNGLCDMHRQQAERAERTKRKRFGPAPS